MSGGYPVADQRRQTAKDAAVELAKLMERRLDYRIDPIALRLFIQAYWARVTVLAHTIHDDV